MKLGFDIDGIVANMSKSMVDHINEKYGLNHTDEIFSSHSCNENTYVDDPELNAEVAYSMREHIIYNDAAVLAIEPYVAGAEAIRKLAKSGHDIHFITVRPKTQEIATAKWLRNNHIPFTSLHVVGKRDLADPNPPIGKGRLGRSLNLDFYIDDYPRHLYDMYRYKNRWRKGVALFTRPWNVEHKLDPSKFLRFDDWDKIIRHLGIQKR